MIKKLLTTLKYNFLILLIIFASIFLLFSLVNLIISGQPRYWEIVHGRTFENLRLNKEKIIQIKRNRSKRSSFTKVFDDNYKKLSYSGKLKIDDCGPIENGYDNLIYQTDKYGFRENIDFRYVFSDYVLLGDSFTQSICENKPNDLKSILLNKTNNSYLNLGMHGTDYAEQFLNLSHYTSETEFRGIIWFFYEGNDYEQKSYNVKNLKNYALGQNEMLNYQDTKYELNINHKLSIYFKFKVWLAEFIRGPSVLLKFFKEYENLLDEEDYNKVLQDVNNYLDKKNIDKRLLVYIPSWQKLSLYKLRKINLYEKHPQAEQLNRLKLSVKQIAEKNGFDFIDTDKYFFNLKNPLEVFHYELNTHFNKFGNQVLSDAVIEQLNQK